MDVPNRLCLCHIVQPSIAYMPCLAYMPWCVLTDAPKVQTRAVGLLILRRISANVNISVFHRYFYISPTIVQVGWRGPNLSRATITATVSLWLSIELWSQSSQSSHRLLLWDFQLSHTDILVTMSLTDIHRGIACCIWGISCNSSDNWSIPDRQCQIVLLEALWI